MMVKAQESKEQIEESKQSNKLINTSSDIQIGCNSLYINSLTNDQKAKQ